MAMSSTPNDRKNRFLCKVGLINEDTALSEALPYSFDRRREMKTKLNNKQYLGRRLITET